jgi:predicted nicotinamide N-methyase
MLMRAGVLDVGAGAALAVMAAKMGVAMVAEAVLRNRMVTHESIHLLTRI